MKGPAPKPRALRQRQNRVSTAAVLSGKGQTRRAPLLPKGHKWHTLTRSWWADVWQSPMAGEFLSSDVHGLYILAELINRFWENPTTSLASEIRQHRLAFGLTPIDRRRLQWEVERVEAVRKRQPTAERKAKSDPRETYLRAVK
jgi:hypothetical protein